MENSPASSNRPCIVPNARELSRRKLRTDTPPASDHWADHRAKHRIAEDHAIAVSQVTGICHLTDSNARWGANGALAPANRNECDPRVKEWCDGCLKDPFDLVIRSPAQPLTPYGAADSHQPES